jgi:hypothetical protein
MALVLLLIFFVLSLDGKDDKNEPEGGIEIA